MDLKQLASQFCNTFGLYSTAEHSACDDLTKILQSVREEALAEGEVEGLSVAFNHAKIIHQSGGDSYLICSRLRFLRSHPKEEVKP